MKLLSIITICFAALCLAGRTHAQTFADVQPIFLSRCAPCHRPGEAAPFPLITYEDVAKRARFIKQVIQTGYMPPWRADTHYRDFANNRSLSRVERDALVKWIDAGAPRGAATQANIPEGTAYSRRPDLTLTIDSPFLVPGDDAERFLVFKLPYELPADRNIEAVEFYCNNKKIIHHINYGFYAVPDSTIDIKGGRPYIDSEDPASRQVEYDGLKKNFVYYTGWIPGASYERYPTGFGWTLPKRGVVLLTVHYSAIGADEHSVVGVNLFFTSKPILRPIQIISLGSGGVGENDIMPPLLIPAGQVDTFNLSVRTQQDQSILYIWPHMHYLGKEFTAWAETPRGDTIPLVHIPRWDFRWQELYRLDRMVRLPAGSVVHIRGVYDNTDGNPFNPFHPPRLVVSTGEMTSTNEMMTLMLLYTPSTPEDK
ncbi:cytochrome c [Dinghuibacter silviterrae]|uniref:Cytochrome c n=1 Tax=Dinghuibacter silviterrae TaxID=1539049 RepID=A0A4R8DF89_9BACT|nr:cytochrome c [Dinghuibacter silviterrae]TDW95904.1 hypothetical protein EDB95_3725 [Dinghuibacter silviterrae]